MNPIRSFFARRKWKKARAKVREKWKADIARAKEYSNFERTIETFSTNLPRVIQTKNPKFIGSQITALKKVTGAIRAIVRKAKKEKNFNRVKTGKKLIERANVVIANAKRALGREQKLRKK